MADDRAVHASVYEMSDDSDEICIDSLNDLYLSDRFRDFLPDDFESDCDDNYWLGSTSEEESDHCAYISPTTLKMKGSINGND